MKLTEKQLAQIFQASKAVNNNAERIDLSDSIDASDKRLNDVERICNDSTVSAAYSITHNLKGWADVIGVEIDARLESSFQHRLLSLFRPLIAATAIALVVFVIVPQQEKSIIKKSNLNGAKPHKMFTSSFEDTDRINSMSFDSNVKNNRKDIITVSSFG